MGKTAAGAVWLNAEQLSPYDYWQFWRNTEDADVGRFLRLFTELPLDEIARLEALGGAEINEAKKVLANRGDRAGARPRGRRRRRRDRARAPSRKAASATTLPTSTIARAELERGVAGVRAVPPRRPRRLQRRGAAPHQGRRRAHQRPGRRRRDRSAVTAADLNADGVIKLSAGRKRHALVRPV